MGWKSTMFITREEAINLILARMDRRIYDAMTDTELATTVEEFGYGDDTNLRYYGYNFRIGNEEENNY